MLVSPAERTKEFWSQLGPTSSIPEEFGADFFTVSKLGTVGVQRKELSDLISSLTDGRVTREVIDMHSLDHAFWVIEGEPDWTEDGELIHSHARFTKDSFQGVMLSLQLSGFHVIRTKTATETRDWLQTLDRYLQKPSHKGLHARPGPYNALGRPNLLDAQAHVLQGLPAIGYDRAVAIVRHYDGLPLCWKEGVDLTEVAGIGAGIWGKVRKIIP